MEKIRPWGQLDWFFERFSQKEWFGIYCLAAEDRCVAAPSRLAAKLDNIPYSLITVLDPMGSLSNEDHPKLKENFGKFESLCGLPDDRETLHLLEPAIDYMGYICDLVDKKGLESIVLDISCFPKRVFFNFVKELYKNTKVCDLVCVYTKPQSYCESEPLASDFGDWEPVAGFSGGYIGAGQNAANKIPFILSIGHQEFGLNSYIGGEEANKFAFHAILPFPPGPPSYYKNWRFLHSFSQDVSIEKIHRLSAVDVSEAFLQIGSVIHDKGGSVLAPFGPKPMSLAMCLIALEYDSAVYYTQPHSYSDTYSKGVDWVGGGVASFAYLIKSNSESLYSIKSPGG